MWALLLVLAPAVAATDCIGYASSLCDADALCRAFGIHGGKIQLHGCNTTVPNNDWAIYTKSASKKYSQLPGHVNVDEAKCAGHPRDMEHTCPTGPTQPPTPAPAPTPAPPKPYKVEGTIDVGTLENSIFSWKGSLYLLENVNSGYTLTTREFGFQSMLGTPTPEFEDLTTA